MEEGEGDRSGRMAAYNSPPITNSRAPQQRMSGIVAGGCGRRRRVADSLGQRTMRAPTSRREPAKVRGRRPGMI